MIGPQQCLTEKGPLLKVSSPCQETRTHLFIMLVASDEIHLRIDADFQLALTDAKH